MAAPLVVFGGIVVRPWQTTVFSGGMNILHELRSELTCRALGRVLDYHGEDHGRQAQDWGFDTIWPPLEVYPTPTSQLVSPSSNIGARPCAGRGAAFSGTNFQYV